MGVSGLAARSGGEYLLRSQAYWCRDYGLKVGFWSFSVLMLINLFVSQKFVHGSHEQGESNQGGVRILLDQPPLDQFFVSGIPGRHWFIFRRCLLIPLYGGIGRE